MQQPAAGLITWGVDATKNTTDRKLTLQDVRLTNAKGMNIVGSKLMLVPDAKYQTLVGARSGWPPRLDKAERSTKDLLDRSANLKDASVPAGDASVAFVVGVKSKPGATSGPIRVRYTDSEGHKFIWNGNTSYRTSPTPCED